MSTVFPIGAGGPVTSWSAQDVVLIYWSLNTADNVATVHSSSAVYAYGDVASTYGSISGFAAAVSTNSAITMAPSPLAASPDTNPEPWDFAIARSCYIVFALRQTPLHTWKFQPSRTAVDFKQDQGGWYSNLFHIQSDGTTAGTTDNSCTVCYFSAYVDPNQGWGSDAFTLYFQYGVGASLAVIDFDPAIKNKGHNH